MTLLLSALSRPCVLYPSFAFGQRHARFKSQVPEFEHPFVRQRRLTLASVGRRRCERYTERRRGEEAKHVATRRFESLYNAVHSTPPATFDVFRPTNSRPTSTARFVYGPRSIPPTAGPGHLIAIDCWILSESRRRRLGRPASHGEMPFGPVQSPRGGAHLHSVRVVVGAHGGRTLVHPHKH